MTLHRRAWTMQLREGSEADYDKAHAAIWPELANQMVADGVRSFHLFRNGLTVFAVQERAGPFPSEDTQPSDITREWWKAMANLMLTDDRGQPLRTDLEEVFSLERTLERQGTTE